MGQGSVRAGTALWPQNSMHIPAVPGLELLGHGTYGLAVERATLGLPVVSSSPTLTVETIFKNPDQT